MLDSTRLESQGLKNPEVTKENYTLTVVFFIIDWKGTDWHFINNLGVRHDFKKEWGWKWQKFFDKMKPGTIHAFLMKSYPKKAGRSGQDFYPVAHVAEFDSLEMARLMNAKYLTEYERNIQHATAREGKLFTLRWCHQLRDWMEHVKAAHDFLAEKANEIFEGAFTQEEIDFAWKAHFNKDAFKVENHQPDPWFVKDLQDFNREWAYLNDKGDVVWLKDPFKDEQVEMAYTENEVENAH